MPVVNIKVIEGVFNSDEKRRMIEKVTDAMASVEGEKLKEKTYVILEEIKSGDWAIGGKIITTEHVKHVQACKGSVPAFSRRACTALFLY
jgi:4-oxalocrotonate tautomerase